jgi:hypothetical protein
MSVDVAMYPCTCIVGGLVPIVTTFIPDRVSVSDDRQLVAELGGLARAKPPLISEKKLNTYNTVAVIIFK